MFDLSIKADDEKWLNVHYPSLKIHKGNNSNEEIAGTLNFSMAYQEGRPYVINPAPDYAEGVKIQDSYQIRIEFKASEFSDLPQVLETGSRIAKVAQSRNLKLEDLHINNPSGAACLCIKPEEAGNFPAGFNIINFFNYLVIPFFYAQSYFEKYNSWPWGQYSHGNLGIIEWYLQQKEFDIQSVNDFLGRLKKYNNWQTLKQLLEQKHKIKGHHLCVCGKDEKFRRCHPEVLQGIWKLKKDIKKFNIIL